MTERRPEVADVFRRYGPRFLEIYDARLSQEQRHVFRDIATCRTAALGGHKLKCDTCGHEEISYNSCRDRHCPKCQAMGGAEWLDREAAHLLDVQYFHVVFTLPEKLGPIALQNKRQVYGILFRAASETLSTIGRDPKHLGAELGFLMVLHTWGQNLLAHPHVHCVVPGGGLSFDGSRWVSCRDGFFLPVRVLSRLFRGKFLAYLEESYAKGELSFHGKLAALQDKAAWSSLVWSLRELEWVVYSKPPFAGPRQVLKYLARYTHRVAISNRRLRSIEDGKVTFSWKDYAGGSKRRTMTLRAEEFIRRFLLHVLPKGFVRIRHYGFLANAVYAQKLALIRRLLARPPIEDTADPQADGPDQADETPCHNGEGISCPRCKKGHLVVIEELRPAVEPQIEDTS